MTQGEAQRQYNEFLAKRNTAIRNATQEYILKNKTKPTSVNDLVGYHGFDLSYFNKLESDIKKTISNYGYVVTNKKVVEAVEHSINTAREEAAKKLNNKAKEIVKTVEDTIKQSVEESIKNRQEHDLQVATNKKNIEDLIKEREAAAAKRHEEYKTKLENTAKTVADSKAKIEEQLKSITNTKTEVNIKSTSDLVNQMKKDAKNILEISTSSLTTEVKTALSELRGTSEIKAVQDIVNKSAKDISNVKNLLKNGLSSNDLNVLSNEAYLKYMQDLITNKMTAQSILDAISTQIFNNYGSILKTAKQTATDVFLIQKAYISAYMKNTFGNPEFVSGIRNAMAQNVEKYLNSLTDNTITNYSKKLDKKIDTTFTRISSKIDKSTGKIISKLDNLTKIDLLENINNKIAKSLSFQSLADKLNKNPITAIFAGGILEIGSIMSLSVTSQLKNAKFLKIIGGVQDKILKISKQVQAAKEFVAKKIQAVKDYVNKLKEKAMEAVKKFATKVINDIKSKISGAITGAIKGIKI